VSKHKYFKKLRIVEAIFAKQQTLHKTNLVVLLLGRVCIALAMFARLSNGLLCFTFNSRGTWQQYVSYNL